MINANLIRSLAEEAARLKEYQLPSGATDEEVDAFLQRTGIAMPPELREWLLIYNGPCLGEGGMYGIRPALEANDIEDRLESYPTWRENQWIPIAGDGCGNRYIVPTRGEFGDGFPVLFIDVHEKPDTPTYIVASSVGKFLEFILAKGLREARNIQEDLLRCWPCNEDVVRVADPDIVRFHGVPFPWDLLSDEEKAIQAR
jgi:cell wall assembly regulator SMI1